MYFDGKSDGAGGRVVEIKPGKPAGTWLRNGRVLNEDFGSPSLSIWGFLKSFELSE